MSDVAGTAVPSASPAATKAAPHDLDEIAVCVLASHALLLAGNTAGARQMMQQAGAKSSAADTGIADEVQEAQRHVERATRVDRVALVAGCVVLAVVLSLLLSALLS